MKHSKCSVRGCKRTVRARTLCSMHHRRWLRHGNPHTVLSRRKKFIPNDIVRLNGVVRIKIVRLNGTVLWTKVDAKDYDGLRLGQHRWYSNWSPQARTYYARTDIYVRGKLQHKGIHQFIFPNAPTVDHRNHNGLVNTRKNLRPATRSQQTMNRRRRRGKYSSEHRGVSRRPENGTWRWDVAARGKRYSGTCKTEILAARAALDKRKELYQDWKTLGKRP